MTASDLASIEDALHIRLPAPYKELMIAYPIPACVGNSDTILWDDPVRLIELNLGYREGTGLGVEPWPENMFAIGDGGIGCPSAIDVSIPSAPVWWVHRGRFDSPSSEKRDDSFAIFFKVYLREFRSHLLEERIDPDGSPEERQAILEEHARSDRRATIFATVFYLTVFGIIGFLLSLLF